MDTYLNAPDLPFILNFPTDDTLAVANAARDWISRGQIFTVAVTNDSSPSRNRYLLINFGAVSSLTVRSDTLDDLDDRSDAAVYTAFLTATGGLQIHTHSLLDHVRGLQPNAPPSQHNPLRNARARSGPPTRTSRTRAPTEVRRNHATAADEVQT